MAKSALNGTGKRRCQSWVDSFLTYSDGIESPMLYRKWSAISVIAATLEQKVFVTTATGSTTFPHLYTFLVGSAGAGKSWAVTLATDIMRRLPDMKFAPTSMTMAALVNHLAEAKRSIVDLPNPMIEYNTLYIVSDELTAFMHEYATELIAGLTAFYDVNPYARSRIYAGDKAVMIAKPQLNILCGTTPTGLIKVLPEFAWEQGFTSRVILIYAEDKPMINLWEAPEGAKTANDLFHDLEIINRLAGPFQYKTEWAQAMHNWKLYEFKPVPEHPKLKSYCTRRERHMIKLSMVASVDRGNDLTLTKEDFNKAMGWLLEAESMMGLVFENIAPSGDSAAMDEILHFVRAFGEKGVKEHQLVNFARTRIQQAFNLPRVLDTMKQAGMIAATSHDPRTGTHIFTAIDQSRPT